MGGGRVNSSEAPSDQRLYSLKGGKSCGFSGFPCHPLSPLPLAEVHVWTGLSAHTQACGQD